MSKSSMAKMLQDNNVKRLTLVLTIGFKQG